LILAGVVLVELKPKTTVTDQKSITDVQNQEDAGDSTGHAKG